MMVIAPQRSRVIARLLASMKKIRCRSDRSRSGRSSGWRSKNVGAILRCPIRSTRRCSGPLRLFGVPLPPKQSLALLHSSLKVIRMPRGRFETGKTQTTAMVCSKLLRFKHSSIHSPDLMRRLRLHGMSLRPKTCLRWRWRSEIDLRRLIERHWMPRLA